MTQPPGFEEARPQPPPLKVLEPDIDSANPWADDALERKEIANRLTSIVREQEVPFVISVDGRWGTGKTFLLKRWQQDLEKQKFQAIYYNAWEDDFADDPLLAIIAQLSEHIGVGFKERAGKLAEAAGPLLSYGVPLAVLLGTGIPVPPIPIGKIPTIGKRSSTKKLNAYRKKRAAKDELKTRLRELALEVRDETSQPLVYIIDELDRCRPTFAIELLERVKHIFDVPNIVFVFGINRSELMKSLESVYGGIESGDYLRKFFDMEFVLPNPDPDLFCEYLFGRYGLDTLLARTAESHQYDIREIKRMLLFVFDTMEMSLRDMDYCVRLLSLALHDLEFRLPVPPELIAILVALKVTNQELYRGFVNGTARGADVIGYISTRRLDDASSAPYRPDQPFGDIDRMEAMIYAADSYGTVSNQISAILGNYELENPQYLTEYHLNLDPENKGDKSKLLSLKSWVDGYGRDQHVYLEEAARKIDVCFTLYYRSIGR